MRKKAPTPGTSTRRKKLLPAGTKCSCGATKWRKENDILDVWFDSGSSHLAVLKGTGVARGRLSGRPGPISRLVSQLAADRHRHSQQPSVQAAWSRTAGRWTKRASPMSKSLGNTLYPAEICERWGADLLRLWVASVEYQADVKMSERVMTQLSEAYRKIRNTFRYGAQQSGRLRPVARRGAQRSARRNGSLDAGAHRRSGETVPRMVCGLRFSSRVSCHPRFLRRGSQLVLLRRLEGSAVHQGGEEQITALRADRGLENHQRAGSPDRTDPGFHRRGNLEISAEGGGRTRKRAHGVCSAKSRSCARTLRRSRWRCGSCSRKCAAKY